MLARLALHRCRIEVAVAGVIEEEIADDATILPGAFGERRLGHDGKQAWRNVARGIVEQGLLVPDEAREEMRPGIGRRSHDDAVEIIGKALSIHQRLTAAARAALAIG